MKVLMISDTEAKGGAAIAAARMARAFARSGMEVGMVVNDPQDGPPVGPWRRFVIRSEKTAEWGEIPVASLENEVNAALSGVLDEFQPDAVSVHNIHGGGKVGWNVEMVRMCADRIPTIWSLHDMWSFTGRCAYPGVCERFSTGCDGLCPLSNQYPFLCREQIAEQFARKSRVLQEAKMLAAATPSRWMEAMAERGIWKDRLIRTISNCIDSDIYRPHNKTVAKAWLGIPEDRSALLACAADFSDERKGAALMIHSLPLLRQKPLTLLVMGNRGMFPSVEGVTVLDLGFVTDPQRKAMAYSAADVLIHPALEDNLPNTVAEALSCGTPVAGFKIGGMADMVLQGETGFLSESQTSEGLAQAVDRCLKNGPLQNKSARSHALQTMNEERFVDSWTRLVEDIET